MEKELGADVIKATQASLGKYVKRPPLSEKLLRKPPFRFLHDIVSAVQKTTGFFEGLFEEDELISENVKDRESKIIFLNKVISVIGTTTGKSLAVKSSKIVAGQEPDKTNELLQCLALALDKKLSSDDAVKKYKDNAKTVTSEISQKETDSSITTKRSNDTKKLKSKSNEKLTTNKKELGIVNNKSEAKVKKIENNVSKNEVQPKKLQQSKNNKNVAVIATNKTKPSTNLKESQHVTNKEATQERDDKTNVDQSNELSNTENTKGTAQLNVKTSKDLLTQCTDQDLLGKLNNSYTVVDNELNTSLSSQDLMEVENSKPTEIFMENNTIDDIIPDQEHGQNTISVIESTILPITSGETLARDDTTERTDEKNELDKSKKNTDKDDSISLSKKRNDVVRPPSVRPSSSRPGAPRLREKNDSVIPDNVSLLLAKVNIITENTNNEDEEESTVVLEQLIENDDSVSETSPIQLQLSSNEHGHLVQQILDSQKKFSQVGKTEIVSIRKATNSGLASAKNIDIEWQFGAQKAKEAVNQEIEQMRFNIQALSRVANPLGKLLDHIQEDAEVMRQELQQWIHVYDEVSKEMQKQKMANDETLVPLQSRMKQLDIGIQEKRDKIDDLKILIHKNTLRFEKLLSNGNVQ